MLFTDKIKNIFITIIQFIYGNMSCTALAFMLVFIHFLNKNNQSIIQSSQFKSNITTLSGVFAGFLFTTFGLLMGLPNNKFTSYLKTSGTLKDIYLSMFIGIIISLITMLLSLYNSNIKLLTFLFAIIISQAISSAVLLMVIVLKGIKSE